MKNIALPSVLAFATLLSASSANAQWLSAEIQIGGGVRVQPPPPPPPPPPQQVVVVQQPPVYYVQPQRYVVVQQPQQVVTYTTTYGWAGNGRQMLGLGAYAAGLGFGGDHDRSGGMGGAGANMRFRYSPHLATEVSLGAMFGRDYNGDLRTEVPLTVSELIYFNPQHRFQFYGIVGLGVAWAGVTYEEDNRASHGGRDVGSYGYFGGLAGLGVEWQLTRNFSLYTDARAFIRTRIDPEVSENPEFTRVRSGQRETTNVSAGLMGQLGAMIYF